MTREGIVDLRLGPAGRRAGADRCGEGIDEPQQLQPSVSAAAELATGILNSAGLPSDPRQAVPGRTRRQHCDDGGHDRSLDASNDRATSIPARGGAWVRARLPRRLCCRSAHASSCRQDPPCAGQHDEAMAVAFRLGELVTEAGMKEVFEPVVEIGERVREGGRRAHAQTYGTRQERDARDAAYAAAFDELMATGTGRMKAYRAVARRHGVSVTTVRRAIRRSSSTLIAHTSLWPILRP